MKEKVTEATVHALASALAGGAAHALYGYFPGERKREWVTMRSAP